MDDFLTNLKPILGKQWLHLLAGLIWSGVGVMLISLAVGWLTVLTIAEALPYVLAGVILAFAIYHWGFSKLSNKNIERINALAGEKVGMFAFQEWKSYPLVLFMIGLGVTLRVYSPIPKPYLAVLYIGIGGGLFLASLHYYWHLWHVQTAGKANEPSPQEYN